MTRSIWLDPVSESVTEKVRHQCDIAIVGGGVIGAACAYTLKKRGLKVMVIEANQVASGASGRNSGFVLRGIQTYYNHTVKRYGRATAREVFAFTETNQRLMREFLDHARVPYEACGSYLLACSLEELEDLAQSAEFLREDSFACTFVKDDPLDRDYYGALSNDEDFALDPVLLVRSLLTSSEATVLENEPVMRFQSEGGQLLVHCAGSIIECSQVFLTTNAYAPLLDQWFAEKVAPTRGQILVTKPLRERILDRICYANYGWEYFRQLPDNRLMLGGCRQHFLDQELGYADMVSRPVQEALQSYLKDRFPEIAGVRIDYRFSGVMGFTHDGLPLVGELKRYPGLFFAVGCNGHGLGFCMNIAKVLTSVALDGGDAGILSADRVQQSVASGREKGP